MTNGINDFGGGHAAVELDPRTGAFVNDTAPGTDGSVLGFDTTPEWADNSSSRYALSDRLRGRGRTILVAAIGGGLLALSLFLRGRSRSRRAAILDRVLLRRSLFGN